MTIEVIRKAMSVCSSHYAYGHHAPHDKERAQVEFDSFISSILDQFQAEVDRADFRHPALRFKAAVQKAATESGLSWLAAAETLCWMGCAFPILSSCEQELTESIKHIAFSYSNADLHTKRFLNPLSGAAGVTGDELTAVAIENSDPSNGQEMSYVHTALYPHYVGSKLLRCSKYDWTHMICSHSHGKCYRNAAMHISPRNLKRPWRYEWQ